MLYYRNRAYVKDVTEIRTNDERATTFSLLTVRLTTSATAGNRQVDIYKQASFKAQCALANDLKAKFNALVDKLNADTGVTDANYSAVATAAATTQATLWALANGIKSKMNTLLAKLDADAGVTLTNYAATAGIASADATTVATCITLLNELRTDLLNALCLLDTDATVADQNYRPTLMTALAALTAPAAVKQCSAVVAASLSKTLIFKVGASDGTDGDVITTGLGADPISIGATESLYIKETTPVASTDTYDVEFWATN